MKTPTKIYKNVDDMTLKQVTDMLGLDVKWFGDTYGIVRTRDTQETIFAGYMDAIWAWLDSTGKLATLESELEHWAVTDDDFAGEVPTIW